MEDNYQCGITYEIYIDPCMSCNQCNILYERDALIQHYNTGKMCCPSNCELRTTINDIRPAAPQFRNALLNIKKKLEKCGETRSILDNEIKFYTSELKNLQDKIDKIKEEIAPIERQLNFILNQLIF